MTPARRGTDEALPVAAVLVAYNSDPARLRMVMAILQGQCRFVVADNSTNAQSSREIAAVVAAAGGRYCNMGGNCGIGAGQNRAIAEARALGCYFALLLDDDSLPHPTMLAELLQAHASLVGRLGPDIVVGAVATDERSGAELSAARPGAAAPYRECANLMSSGSLVPLHLLERVGPMDERLFIDYVDFDWGWRARRAGCRLFLVQGARMRHSLGQGSITLASLRMHIPAPVRHYFQFRNYFYLLPKPYVPFAWKAERAVVMPLKLVLLLFAASQPVDRLCHAFRGIVDGLRGAPRQRSLLQ